MIGKLKGTISNPTNPLIVDVHDVGYLVHITDKLRSELKAHTSYEFFIYTHIRDDAFDLYGFTTTEELELFKLLLTVSGIGPKTALTVVGRGASAVERAVKLSDVEFFTSVPRLGRKNAQKIIIELKTKLGSLMDLNLSGDNGETKQIVDALVSMGFAKQEVNTVLEKIADTEETLEEKIRHALKLLGRRV
jgi:holliday junction DNA helicase RuvA